MQRRSGGKRNETCDAKRYERRIEADDEAVASFDAPLQPLRQISRKHYLTQGVACVSVPVLSNTTVFALARASRYFPPLTITCVSSS